MEIDAAVVCVLCIGVRCGACSQLSSTRGFAQETEHEILACLITHVVSAFASVCHIVLVSKKKCAFLVLGTTAVPACKNYVVCG